MNIFTSGRAALKALACAVALFSVLGNALAQTDDPPGRVARLNYISGSVTFAPAASDQWAYAELNRPMTTGDSVWADRDARAELHIGSTAVRMESRTSLNILNLTDDLAQLKLSQGSLNVRVLALSGNQIFEIDTPNLAFSIQEPGEYRLSVAEDGSVTVVTVRRGIGIVYGDNDSLTLHGNEQMQFSGTDLSQVGLGSAAPYDSFDAWAHERDLAEDASMSARYVSREIIGYEQLDNYGTWSNDPEYGAVWIPSVVAVGWSPYRTGHWTWVAPWGWTWIDDAPWGFAPYHYGRWARIHSGWCWVPGPRLQAAPVYAPALVAFVGGGIGASFSLSFSSGRDRGPGVAWFPLAPGERYQPGYHASPRYFNRINETTIINRTTVNNVTTINNVTNNIYRNQNVPNAVTAIPAAAFVKGQAVGPIARSLRPSDFGKASVATAAPQFAPVKESILGNARPAAMPAGARLMQRPVVATVAPPVAPARRDALAQQFAQHPAAAIPGAGPALVRQQGAGAQNPGQGSRNPGTPGMPDGRGRQPALGADPSSVRLIAGHSADARRGNVGEQRLAPAPSQPGGSRPGNMEAGPGSSNPQPRELTNNMQRPGNVVMPPAGGNRQPPQPVDLEGGRGAPPANRQAMPMQPAPNVAPAAPVATVPQPPRDTGRQEYRPTLEHRGGEMTAPSAQPQREVPRGQPALPRPPEQAPAVQAPPRPVPRLQEAAPPQPQVQPPRRIERSESFDVRREAPRVQEAAPPAPQVQQPVPRRMEPPVEVRREAPRPQEAVPPAPQVQQPAPRRMEPPVEVRREAPPPPPPHPAAPVVRPAPLPAPAPVKQEREIREKSVAPTQRNE